MEFDGRNHAVILTSRKKGDKLNFTAKKGFVMMRCETVHSIRPNPIDFGQYEKCIYTKIKTLDVKQPNFV